MTQPRPSRTARWVIGISVTVLPALVALGLGFVMLAQLTTSDPGVPLTGRATAKVLDIDTYNSDDLPIPTSSQWAQNGGYAEVDVDFRVHGEHEVTVMDWPDGRVLPAEGDQLLIGYDPADPEYAPALSDTLGAGDLPTADNSPGAFTTGTILVEVIAGVLALLGLLGTVLWARRAPARIQAGGSAWGPVPTWGQPGPTWGPVPTWGQPGPTWGQPVLSSGQPVLSSGQPVPSSGQPVPSWGQPPQSSGQTPQNWTQPPPSGQLPSPSQPPGPSQPFGQSEPPGQSESAGQNRQPQPGQREDPPDGDQPSPWTLSQ